VFTCNAFSPHLELFSLSRGLVGMEVKEFLAESKCMSLPKLRSEEEKLEIEKSPTIAIETETKADGAFGHNPGLADYAKSAIGRYRDGYFGGKKSNSNWSSRSNFGASTSLRCIEKQI